MLPLVVTTGAVFRAPLLLTPAEVPVAAAGVAVLMTVGVLVTTVGVVTVGVSGIKTLDSVGCIKPADCTVLVVPVAVTPVLGFAVLVDAVFDTPVVVSAAVFTPELVPAWPRRGLSRQCACASDLLHAHAVEQTLHVTSCTHPSV